MRLVSASGVQGLEQISPLVWRAPDECQADEEPGFIFDVPPKAGGFIAFFLMEAQGTVAPKVYFDQGSGFNELTAITLRSFPFAFYHFSFETMRDVERIRFRPCLGATTFRFLALRTTRAIPVAILHYLFNLRYQKIGLIAPDSKGRIGFIPAFASNVARIVKFFRDVSKGAGVRVQQGSEEVLPALKLFLSVEAEAVGKAMDVVLAHRHDRPLLSFICPTYNTRAAHLTDLLQSFCGQHAGYAELILSDDGSPSRAARDRMAQARAMPGVFVTLNAENKGIAAATNAGIAASRGEWIAFIDHDDQFVPGAIAVIAQAIHDHPDADFFYTDEIIGDASLRPTGCFCKPAYDSVLLSGLNYINHFSIFRRSKLEAMGGLRTDREGSQDHDLLLRYLRDAAPGSAVHIPFLAYIWRREERTYSTLHVDRSVASARLALKTVFAEAGHAVEIAPALDTNLHRVRFSAPKTPVVSVIIPNRDSLDLITRVARDVLSRTAYAAIEIVIVDNGTRDTAVLAFYDRLCRDHARCRVEIEEEPFNFARMCNRGARLARGDALLFLNNDIEVQADDWLGEMIECLSFEAAGIVGAKLLYPNGTIQHNGVIIGLGGAAGHWYIGEAVDEPGPINRFSVRQTLTAVTGACMLVTRGCFEAVGGFDENAFAIAYNDIDLCLRARALGYRTIWTPFAQLIHHESATRGSDDSGENNLRFKAEFSRLQERHGTEMYLDDAYSPFFDRRYSKPHLILPDALPASRPNRFS